MCGSTGDAIDNIQRQNEGRNRSARQYKREKIDEQTEAGQDRFGQATGDAYDSWEMGVDDSREVIRRNTESLPGTAGPYEEEVDTSTAEANYSSSGQTQTSSGTGKKADLSDTDNKDPKGASANLTVKPKKKPKED
tara:strand:- start:191 stop:598 length:408 start_codon:yes stop_codon:yes gene_type:complete